MEFDLYTLLKAPFPIDSLSWRVGNKSNWDKTSKKPKDPNKPVKAQMLVYIDARDVQDRLDEVCALCGTHWQNDFKEVGGRLICNLQIGIVKRTDGAGDTDFEAEKGGLSDAFKRSAVMFGVGRYLYNAKNFNTWLQYEDGETDFDMPNKAKEVLKDVAISLGKPVQTYTYWLELIKSCTEDELPEIVELSRTYAKRENWSTGNLETFKENIEKKKREFKEKKDGSKE